MKVVHWSPELKLPSKPRVVALGAFDGLHIGHVKTIQAMRGIAHEHGAEAAVLTFDPSPREFDFTTMTRQPGRRLTPAPEQQYYLHRLGIDLTVVFEFPGEIYRIEPEEFVREVLVRQCRAIHVTASNTHRFGHRGRGDLRLLRQLGAQYGFGVETVSSLTVGGERVSSTRIRNLLFEGRVHEAGALLGRPYAIYSPVVPGAGRGTKLGFPTANLQIPPEKVLPRDGVYAGLCGKVRGSDYEAIEDPLPAAINVGLAPTVRGDERIVEVHVVGQQCDFENASIKVEFLRWLRGEQKFESADALVAQIGRDVVRTADVVEEFEDEKLQAFEQFCTTDYVVRRGGHDG